MKRMLMVLLALTVFSSQVFAAKKKVTATSSGETLPTISLMTCANCPPLASSQPQGSAPGAMMAGCTTMTDTLERMVDVMKMQQTLIAGEDGSKNRKAAAEIDSRISEIDRMIVRLKRTPMPCATGGAPMQGMPCATGKPCPPAGQPCPATGKPCPNMAQPQASSAVQ